MSDCLHRFRRRGSVGNRNPWGSQKLKGLVTCLAWSIEFRFGGIDKENVDLTAALPRNRSTVDHEDVAGVWAVSINAAGRICVDPFLHLVCFSSAAVVINQPLLITYIKYHRNAVERAFLQQRIRWVPAELAAPKHQRLGGHQRHTE